MSCWFCIIAACPCCSVWQYCMTPVNNIVWSFRTMSKWLMPCATALHIHRAHFQLVQITQETPIATHRCMDVTLTAEVSTNTPNAIRSVLQASVHIKHSSVVGAGAGTKMPNTIESGLKGSIHIKHSSVVATLCLPCAHAISTAQHSTAQAPKNRLFKPSSHLKSVLLLLQDVDPSRNVAYLLTHDLHMQKPDQRLTELLTMIITILITTITITTTFIII